jgi:LysM repeat protein
METSTTKSLSTVIARLAAFLALGAVVVVLIVVVSSSLEGSNGEDRPREKTPPREPQRPKEKTYVVQPNDTLGSIAEKTGVPVEALLRLNPDIDPQALPAGAELKLRKGS